MMCVYNVAFANVAKIFGKKVVCEIFLQKKDVFVFAVVWRVENIS